jgi:tRNA A-37 threonylcarbamoyl transferase component Bud32
MSASTPTIPTVSPTARPEHPAARIPHTNGHPSPLLTPLINQIYVDDREYRRYAHTPIAADPASLQDFIFHADDGAPVDPDAIFHRLRWGGQFVFASRHPRRVAELSRIFDVDGFRLEREPAFVRKRWPFLSFLAPRVHYFAARKVYLIRPGEFTERFTYHVELVPHQAPQDEEFVVLKTVPSLESLVAKLRRKFPDTPVEAIEKRARKFTDKIFPTFLTREAGILKILEEHLPSRYAHRVPRVIDFQRDIRGFVTSLKMNWLRNGGRRLSQLEFATQAADLLRAIHDNAGVLHLDLRLDNMVITEHGVGFIDFGSSMRVTENLATNPMLDTLFSELMRTSHIQRMLYHMTNSGQVTAKHFCETQGKADKGIDVFYLSLQFTTPHANPDLASLIHYDPDSEMARQIAELSKTVLRPGDPADTTHKSAKDILRSLELLERDITRRARKSR